MEELRIDPASFSYSSRDTHRLNTDQLNSLLVPQKVTQTSLGISSLRLVSTSLTDAKLLKLTLTPARELKYLTLVDQLFTDFPLKKAVFPILSRLIYLDIRHNYFLSDAFISEIKLASEDLQLKLLVDEPLAEKNDAFNEDLSSSKLGDLGMVSLCRYLRLASESRSEGQMRLRLNLSSNKIGDRGAEVLAKTLDLHPTCLKSIDLSYNYISNRGWKVLHAAIRNSSVEDVRILSNPITTPPAQLISPESNLAPCRIALDHATLQDGCWSLTGGRSPCRPRSGKRGVLSSPRHKLATTDAKAAKKAREIQRIYRTSNNVLPSPPKRVKTNKKPGRRTRRGRRLRHKHKKRRKHKVNKQRDPQDSQSPQTTASDSQCRTASKQDMTLVPSTTVKAQHGCDNASVKGNMPVTLSSKKAEMGRKALADHKFTDSFIQLQSAIKIQGLYRCMLARRKVEVVKYISRLKGNRKATDSAVTIQRNARGKIARCTVRKLELKAVLIQKVFRRYYARTRLLNAARLATKNALIVKDFVDQIKSIYVRDCGTLGCKGRYDIAGAQEDHTRRYVRAQSSGDEDNGIEYIYTIERTSVLAKEAQGGSAEEDGKGQGKGPCWVLIQHKSSSGADTSNSTILYINSAEGLSLKPPTHSWEMVAGQKPEPTIEWRRESVDAAHHRMHAFKPGFTISEAGVQRIQGKFIQAGNSDGVLAYRLLKGKSSSPGETWLRRIRYLSSKKKLWIICTGTESQVEVLYVNSEEGHMDTPPCTECSGSWKLGQHGRAPIPLIVKHKLSGKQGSIKTSSTVEATLKTRREAIRKEREAAKEKFGTHEELSEEDTVVKAAERIQRNYRSYMLLNLSKNPRMIKEVRSVHNIRVDRCGEVRARGIYALSGVSSHFSNSMRYIKEVSEEEMYIVERMENNTWSLVQLLNAQVNLLYANSEDGFSLRPPLQRWQSVNALEAPSPKLEWIKEEHAPHYDIFHSKLNSKEPAFLMLDSGTTKIHGRYEEAGESDGVPMYRLTRNIKVQMRRVKYKSVSLWLICRPTKDVNLVYFVNTNHGHSETPPLDDWVVAQHGDNPCPIILLAPTE